MEKAPRVNRQRLSRDAISAAKSYHLVGDVVFIGGTLEQGTHSSLLLVGWIEVGSGAGAFKVPRGNAIDQDAWRKPQRWLRQAEQAAQKALKAFLIWQGQRSVPLHSVAQLAERCAAFDPDFAAHITAGRVLDQYYIPTRYPDALAPPAVPFESYTHEQGDRAVMAVQTLLVLVTQKLTPAPEQP